jgi:hypothetical protein
MGMTWRFALAGSALLVACSSNSNDEPGGNRPSGDMDADSARAAAGAGADPSSAGRGDRDAGASSSAVGKIDAGSSNGEPDGATAAPPDTSDWPLRDCAPDAPGTGANTQASVASRVQGTNGQYADRCDASGNLIEYSCEERMMCEQGPNPGCSYTRTGRVRPALFDCAGRCRDGACAEACPSVGQNIVYEEADGAGLFVVRNEADGERYTCVVGFDNGGDDHDCTTAPRSGGRARIDAATAGASGTCRSHFNLAVVAEGSDVPPNTSQCSYRCRHGRVEQAGEPQGTAALTTCPGAREVATGPTQGSPDEAQRFSGSNGEHADSCTADGNLIDYSCVVLSLSQGPPWSAYSGAVGADLVDCGGSCRAGACVRSCPAASQALVFSAGVTDGVATVRNESEDGRSYACAIVWDDPTDAFECEAIAAGDRVTIIAPVANVGLCVSLLPELPIAFEGEASSCSGCPHCRLSCRVAP